MDVLLIRHGQSANNALAEHLRVPDPGLTELGKLQAAATADRLRDRPIDRLYCSPFTRSLETMRPIAAARNQIVHVRGDLFEQGGCYSGHLQGQYRGEPGLGRRRLVENYPGWLIDDGISDRGWWGREYESLEQARRRAELVNQWLSGQAQAGGHVALVIHADFKRLLLESMLTTRNGELTEVIFYNAGITTLQWRSDQWQLQELNATDHLRQDWIT